MVVEVVVETALLLLVHQTLDLLAVVLNPMVLIHHLQLHKDMLAVVVAKLETMVETVVVLDQQQGMFPAVLVMV
tara:strand:- start:378 stop:599 length:222 start_codon:yes stop_codon:yes gene_type:complete